MRSIVLATGRAAERGKIMRWVLCAICSAIATFFFSAASEFTERERGYAWIVGIGMVFALLALGLLIEGILLRFPVSRPYTD